MYLSWYIHTMMSGIITDACLKRTLAGKSINRQSKVINNWFHTEKKQECQISLINEIQQSMFMMHILVLKLLVNNRYNKTSLFWIFINASYRQIQPNLVFFPKNIYMKTSYIKVLSNLEILNQHHRCHTRNRKG